MALVKSVLVLVCMPVLGAVAFYPAVSTHTLASVPKARCAAAAAPAPLKLRMRDTWKRIGSLAKDKLGGAKDWVDSGAKPERDMNVRGAATGAVVGGLIAGPFGALVGGWLGKGSGMSKAAEDKELERLGMTRESATLMKQLLTDFQESSAVLADVTSSCKDFENRVSRLKKEVDSSFQAAKAKLEAGDEDGARRHLTDKVNAEEQLRKAEETFLDMDERRRQLKVGVDALEDRLLDVQATATRARTASARLQQLDPLEGGAMDGTIRDPLLDKFEKWEKEDKK